MRGALLTQTQTEPDLELNQQSGSRTPGRN